jgi:putative DNA primase/helicase
VARQLPEDSDAAAAFRRRMLSAPGVTNVLRLAQNDDRVVVRIGDLDSDPFTLNTPAGIVDLRSGDVREQSPEDLVTKITGCAVSFADCSQFRAFLGETFGDDPDLIGYVQRLLGYSAIGTVTEHVLSLCFGVGANGKSVLLDVSVKVLATTKTATRSLHRRTFSCSAWAPTIRPSWPGLAARMVSCQDVNSDQRFDEAKIKQLTGGDVLAGRFMRRDFLSLSPSHHLWLCVNHKPIVRDGGLAFWRRSSR